MISDSPPDLWPQQVLCDLISYYSPHLFRSLYIRLSLLAHSWLIPSLLLYLFKYLLNKAFADYTFWSALLYFFPYYLLFNTIDRFILLVYHSPLVFKFHKGNLFFFFTVLFTNVCPTSWIALGSNTQMFTEWLKRPQDGAQSDSHWKIYSIYD